MNFMALFLTIREGDEPGDSYPVLASADPEIIEIVARAIARKLAPGVDVRPLRPAPKLKEHRQDEDSKD